MRRSWGLGILPVVFAFGLVLAACGGDDDDDGNGDATGGAPATSAPEAFADRSATPDVEGLRRDAPPVPPTPVPAVATEGTLTGGSGRSDITVLTADGSEVMFSVSGSRTTIVGTTRDDLADGMKVAVFDDGNDPAEATTITIVP